jgi:hypothetical protein
MKINHKLLLFIIIATSPCFSKSKKQKKSPATKSFPITLDRKKNKSGIPNFRKAHDQFLHYTAASRHGLENLKASASGQLSKADIATLKNKLGVAKLVLFDLRGEPHALSHEGEPFHWKKKINTHDPKVILQEEKKLLAQLAQAKKWRSKQSHATEFEVATAHGIHAHRLPIQAGQVPHDTIVNRMVEVFDTMDKDTGLHIHCRQGNGRASTGFIMYDMYHHAHYVSYADFLARHHALGGVSLADKSKYAPHRTFLKSFHAFCKARKNNPSLTWTSYKKNVAR